MKRVEPQEDKDKIAGAGAGAGAGASSNKEIVDAQPQSMDGYSGKRAVSGLVDPRKGSRLVLRETADNKDQKAQFCNRIGCSGRLHYMKCTQTGSSEKPKSLGDTFRSSSGKEVIGSSSRACTVNHGKKKVSNNKQTDSSSENSSVQGESEGSEASPRRTRTELSSQVRGAYSSKVTLMEVGSPSASVASNSRSQKTFRQKFGSGQPGSSVSSASSKVTYQGTSDLAKDASNSRYGLRNLRCNSLLDVVPQASESNMGRKRDMVKRSNPEGYRSSSSVGGKKMSGPISSSTSSSISISDSTGRVGNQRPPNREVGAASVRTRRSMNFSTRVGQVNGIKSPRTGVIPQMHQPELSIHENMSTSLHQFSGEGSSSRSSCYSHSDDSSDGLSSLMPSNSAGLGISRLANRDGSRRHNMEGIAEVLLALERIEQDEELTYEQLLALESNLFLGSLNFFDQHRDMRLDIDNMSYEELLALEEKMGTVSTALSEEAMCNCVKRSIYQPMLPEEGTIGCSGDHDNIKCSICQEEYVDGDEMGRLGCEHGYHAVCIQDWLRLKNWCPICKASAVRSQQSTSLS